MRKYTTNGVVVPSGSPEAPTLDIPAFGGRLDVCWDQNAEVTQWGGLCYLSAFLNVAGLLDRLVEDAPFVYTSNNSPGMRNLVGTIVLSILCGFTRYLHIERLRNDTACAKLLGMTKIVSETCVRRALKEHVDEAALEAWLLKHERETAGALLKFPYVLDIDNTVKPIYGHQEGAEVGYNPQKPGRPSHNFHSYFIGVARIALGVDVQPGKRHSGGCGMTGLWTFLESLPQGERPKFLRGDVGYGTEAIMCDAESLKQLYLLKIKRTWGVRSLFKQYENSNLWKDCGCGWQAIDTVIQLQGWSKPRRCILLRRPSKDADKPEIEMRPKRRGRPKKNALVPVQQEFDFVKGKSGRLWDTCALVTNDTEFDAIALSQLYRDRGDCENNFDEYKNQWGWGGFVTSDLAPCRAMARLIAIVANWWNVFCRLADPDKHLEPITSRPKLMNIVGRIITSGRRKMIRLTSSHAEFREIQEALAKIGEFMKRISSSARQLGFNRVWALILRVAFRKFLSGGSLTPTAISALNPIPLPA